MPAQEVRDTGLARVASQPKGRLAVAGASVHVATPRQQDLGDRLHPTGRRVVKWREPAALTYGYVRAPLDEEQGDPLLAAG